VVDLLGDLERLELQQVRLFKDLLVVLEQTALEIE
tara:strand:+ start:107 stop:211 length:105 start_codon:yes stop_codon:yes gene_type:complete